MADETLIKQITVNGVGHKIDYESLGNLPVIPGDKSAEIEALQAQVAALSPKKVTFTLDENISELTISDYEGQEDDDKHKWIGDKLTYVYARNGNFGYPCIDGTGQVNFTPALAEGYDVVIPAVEGNYNKFKTPYSTCVDNLYRFTKVSSDLAVSLTAAKESEMSAWTVTYTLSLPEGYTGNAPVVTEYRTNDAMLAKYKPSVIEFTDGSYSSVSYNKATGYPDATEGDAAQVNFTVDCDLVEGYTMSVVPTATYKNFNTPDNTEGWTDQYQLTKLKGDTTIAITIAAPVNVTYTAGTYSFSTDTSEIPAKVGQGSALVFAFYHQTNCQNPTKDTACVPDGTDCGGSGALPTAEACLERIDSVTIGGTAYDVTADMIAVSGKKATVTIPGSAITADVVVTLKTVVAEESSEEVTA